MATKVSLFSKEIPTKVEKEDEDEARPSQEREEREEEFKRSPLLSNIYG